MGCQPTYGQRQHTTLRAFDGIIWRMLMHISYADPEQWNIEHD
jgi:hypothetical protein